MFVSLQHYESYCDDEIWDKAVYIYNIVIPLDVKKKSAKDKKNIVTYVGALVYTKGFHKLAKKWKYIVKKVPDAELYVIGDGKLYDKNVQMGDYDIAEKKYEDKFIRFLLEDDGSIMASVHFLGTLGRDKKKYIEETKVGVVNPIGKSETFCLSAVEFEGSRIPVVAYKGYGFLDTVADKKTGILCRNGYLFARAIIKLLKNDNLNDELGVNGENFYREKFMPYIIFPQWERLLFSVVEEIPFCSECEFKFLWDDWKWLKYLNRRIKKCIDGRWNSISYTISVIKEEIKKLYR